MSFCGQIDLVLAEIRFNRFINEEVRVLFLMTVNSNNRVALAKLNFFQDDYIIQFFFTYSKVYFLC